MSSQYKVVSSFLAISILVLPTALRAFATGSDVDKIFVGKVSQGGAYEVAASQYAETRAVAPDVRDLAVMEVHDHLMVGTKLNKTATTSGIAVSPILNAEFSDRLAKLKAVRAADFDAAYIADMQAIHDKDEKLFAQEAEQGSDSFRMFAHQTDQIVKRHIGALHGLDAK